MDLELTAEQDVVRSTAREFCDREIVPFARSSGGPIPRSAAAGCVGIAQGCLEASVSYARDRVQFDRPIARFQLVQELIADIAVETEAARMLTWKLAALADAGTALG